MTKLSKLVTGAAAAIVTLIAAAPAQAQYYPHQRDNVDVGDIVRGVAIAGAAAVAVGAIANAARGGSYGYPQGGYGYPQSGYGYPQGGYGYPQGGYGYPNSGYGAGYGNQNLEQYAVNACGQRASRYGRVSVTQVQPRNRSSLRVRGIVEGGSYDAGWGQNGRYERRSFSCTVRYDGRVTDFDTDRIRY